MWPAPLRGGDQQGAVQDAGVTWGGPGNRGLVAAQPISGEARCSTYWVLSDSTLTAPHRAPPLGISEEDRILELDRRLSILWPERAAPHAVLMDPALLWKETKRSLPGRRVHRSRLCHPRFLDRLSYWTRLKNDRAGDALRLESRVKIRAVKSPSGRRAKVRLVFTLTDRWAESERSARWSTAPRVPTKSSPSRTRCFPTGGVCWRWRQSSGSA